MQSRDIDPIRPSDTAGTDAQKEALQIVGRLVIANMELRSDLQELKDALARQAAGGSSEGSVNLEEIIFRLQGVASDLQAVREGKKPV